MARPTVVSVSPVSGAVGVPVNTQIKVTFDSEIDTYRLSNGGIVIEGPDQSKSIGGGLIGTYPIKTNEDEFLSSPNLKGIVKDLEYSFRRVDNLGDGTFSGYDYGSGSGSGTLFRTEAIVTLTYPLSPETQYTIYVVGDPDVTDSLDYGLSSRTVFDLIRGLNLGTGTPIFWGGFSGTVAEQFFVEVTASGETGTARYEWWTDREPVHRSARTSQGYRLLKDGVRIKFPVDEEFESGDTFSVWCRPAEFMDGGYSSSFTTSRQSYQAIPDSSTVIVGSGTWGSSSTVTPSLAGFSILSTTPGDREGGVPTSLTEISLTASSSVLEASLAGSITVTSFPADESTDGGIPALGALSFTSAVSGSVITLTLLPEQLFPNNLVVISVGPSLSSTEGALFGETAEFYFVTTLTPMYAGPRQVRLLLGPLGNSYPDDTINFAIWEASREVAAIGPITIHNGRAFNLARNRYVVCAAAMILSGSVRISSGGARKRLADLDISRDAGGMMSFNNDLKTCLDRYELAMMSGGETGFGAGLPPVTVIKGEHDLDEPLFGRGWIPTSPGIANTRVISSGGRRWPQTYRRKN
jgi:hypothetical protein